LRQAREISRVPRCIRASLPEDTVPDTEKANFGFTKLLVADLERSAVFYEAVCGFEQAGRVDADVAGRKLSEILFRPTSPGGPTLVLLHFADAARPSSDEVILGMTTPDIDRFIARVKRAGGTLVEAPYRREDGGIAFKVAFVKDPEGHLIEIVQML
jgi:lactoylglutathione lyase